jgi:hypothetical protein
MSSIMGGVYTVAGIPIEPGMAFGFIAAEHALVCINPPRRTQNCTS